MDSQNKAKITFWGNKRRRRDGTDGRGCWWCALRKPMMFSTYYRMLFCGLFVSSPPSLHGQQRAAKGPARLPLPIYESSKRSWPSQLWLAHTIIIQMRALRGQQQQQQ
jgi:hypothetical protein